jgi:hypothetical protein
MPAFLKGKSTRLNMIARVSVAISWVAFGTTKFQIDYEKSTDKHQAMCIQMKLASTRLNGFGHSEIKRCISETDRNC